MTARERPLLRRCPCGGGAGPGGECAACRKRRLQREARGASPAVAPPIVHDVLRSAGRPLEPAVRTEMETRLGHDFSRVRVHTDTPAAASARAVEAHAYTVGSDIAFNTGRYRPDDVEGRRLLAHELTHVVQQGGSRPAGPIQIGDPFDAAERAADAAAEGTAAGRARPSLQRKLVVNPKGMAQVLAGVNFICQQGNAVAAADGKTVKTTCPASAAGEGCACACDVIADAARTYTITVSDPVVTKKSRKLANGNTDSVPDTTAFPVTTVGPNPLITLPDWGTSVQFGEFDPAGKAQWVDSWRILAHELCGHGRLNQSAGGDTGKRPGHDVTIDTENAIAKERGHPARGHFNNPRQGESFFNAPGDPKVVFKLKDGLHYEAP